ncbi:MAG: hypothetical protein GXP62_14235 [Oligoflexia bacterium]|nr:hypothetical protein [Oligoflexia bacterium]
MPATRSSQPIVIVYRLFGLAILGIVGWVYFHAQRTGTMPPSHPWSGLTLSLLGLGALLGPRGRGNRLEIVRAGAAVLALVGAVFWLFSAGG